jgi:mannose-1-phosphate guanylyltransferase
MVPTHAETGYGYIERGDRIGESKGKTIHSVKRFVEKPNQETAERYADSGSFLWNSGMFVFPSEAMHEEIAIHMPDLHAKLRELEASPKEIHRIYPTLPALSIDYGIMEKSERIAVMPAAFAWSDVGSWDAATDVYPLDDLDNTVLGQAVLHQVQRSFVDSSAGRMVAVIGLEDVIIVDTPDALLVVKKGRSQEVKSIVQALEKSGRDDLL